MRNPALFYGAILVAIIGVALGVFFLIPGVNHIITSSGQHIKHAILFFGIAVVGLLAALVTRPRAGLAR